MSNIQCVFDVLKRIRKTARTIVKRAVVSLVGDDSGSYNITQITYGSPEKTANSEVVSPYGLYVNLPVDTQVILFSVCGDEENRACIGYSQEDRFKNLEEGEVLVGNPKAGTYIKFKSNGDIDIHSASDVNITATNVKVNATKVDLGVGGNKIARLGDAVKVDTGTGDGTITSAGTNTSI